MAKLELPRIREMYGITDDDIADLLALFILRGDLVIPDKQVTVCRDIEDNMVIEAALAGEAPGVITGGQDVLSLGITKPSASSPHVPFWKALAKQYKALTPMWRQTAVTKRR